MVGVKVDTREFDKAFREYMKYTKRSVVEAINQHAYYAARDAVLLTKATTKEKVRKDLESPSRDYQGVPLAAILVNMQRARHSQKGLTGEKMARAVEKFIKGRERSRNFLKAGWIPAVRILEGMVPKKGGSSIAGVKPKGRPKGGAKGASRWIVNIVASIWNEVQGGKTDSAEAHQIIEEGANAAIRMETDSMWKYIERKMDEANQKHMT